MTDACTEALMRRLQNQEDVGIDGKSYRMGFEDGRKGKTIEERFSNFHETISEVRNEEPNTRTNLGIDRVRLDRRGTDEFPSDVAGVDGASGRRTEHIESPSQAPTMKCVRDWPQEYYCSKCGRDMESSVIHPPHEGTRVFWHKDGTPDNCTPKAESLSSVARPKLSGEEIQKAAKDTSGWHACGSGDCDHDKWTECCESLFTEGAEWATEHLGVTLTASSESPIPTDESDVVVKLRQQIRELKRECRLWERAATDWMNSYDRMCAKYEPVELVTSESLPSGASTNELVLENYCTEADDLIRQFRTVLADVKKWRDSDGNEGFPHETRVEIERLLGLKLIAESSIAEPAKEEPKYEDQLLKANAHLAKYHSIFEEDEGTTDERNDSAISQLKENEGQLKESDGELLQRLGMDGQKWAAEFMHKWNGHVVGANDTIDESLMIGWFCNAIMAGYDTANNRAQRRIAELEAENAALRAQAEKRKDALEKAHDYLWLCNIKLKAPEPFMVEEIEQALEETGE